MSRLSHGVCCVLVNSCVYSFAQGSRHQPPVTLPQSQVAQARPGLDASNQPAVPVTLRLTAAVSSADAKVGEPVQLEVVNPVEVDGKIAIASGAKAYATITQVKHRGHNRREGRIVFSVTGVDLAGGGQAPVTIAIQRGSGKGNFIFGPCTFPLPADPVGLFRKGKDVVISKNTEFIAAFFPNSSHLP